MKTLLTILALAFFTGCKSSEDPPIQPGERLQGHVTVVAGGADFVVTKPVYRRFQAPTKSFPEEVWKYLWSQPEHEDYSSINSKGQAVWVDVTGHVRDEEGWNSKGFVAIKIHQMGPAHPRYLAWRRVYGSGPHVPDYTD